eukprot:TRINITY_DN7527_c0_g1_i1.p1 TRINITY_DN7527_c0_g1~~TRINITY_DN7527_c0_g1_i1.p1  ORF type:complete len:586 (-),score=155.31 TRINITY_DN7527_c0_g1_i1:36-1793(-)
MMPVMLLTIPGRVTFQEKRVIPTFHTSITNMDDLMQFLPKSFGKKEEEKYDASDVINHTRKKKVVPKVRKPRRNVGEHEPEPTYRYGIDEIPDGNKKKRYREEDYETVDLDPSLNIPYTHEVNLQGHSRVVSSLALDPSGTRLLTGGYDSFIKFWDLPNLDHERLSNFRELEPYPGQVIHTLDYSATGDRFIAAGSSKQVKVFNRDGHEKFTTPIGYQYITDMASTKGHIARITAAFWHPTDTNLIVTSSHDSSVRIWDTNVSKKHRDIFKVRNSRGLAKSPVNGCVMSPNGKQIYAAAQDGCLHRFDVRTGRCNKRIQNIHGYGADVSCMKFSEDERQFIVRATDDSLKVWDSRKLDDGPVKLWSDLPNKYEETSCLFSPGEKYIVTGTSVIGDTQELGKLVFFDRNSFVKVKEVDVSSGSVVSIIWNEKTNQIITGCSEKIVHIFYNPEISKKGILLSLKRAPKKRKIEDSIQHRNIMNPHALPMFKQAPSARRQREKARNDPVLSHRPEPPQIGPGSGGRLGSSLTASIMKDLVPKTEITADPREAILRYAKQAEENPMFFGNAYKDTQPKNEDDKNEEDEE